MPLAAFQLFVGASCFLSARELRDSCDGYVPPRRAVRRGNHWVGLDVYDCRPGGSLRLDDSVAELIDAIRAEHIGTQTRRVCGKVDRKPVAIEAGLGAVAVLRAESLRTQRL